MFQVMKEIEAAINALGKRSISGKAEFVIISFESAATAMGAVVQGALVDELFLKLANLADFPHLDDEAHEFIPLTGRMDIPPKPDKNNGFVLINGKTWQPKALYEARLRQRRNQALRPENGVVWTR